MWEACHVEIAIVDIACFAWPTMLSDPVSPVRIQPFEHQKQWKRDYCLKGKGSCMQIVGVDTRSHNTPLYSVRSTDKH